MASGKKKSHVGLTIFIVILVILLLPVVLVYALCYDNAKHDSNIEPKEVSTVVDDSLFKSFLNAKSERKLNFSIGQAELNQVFKSLYNKLGQPVTQYVKGLYVEINHDKYDFFVEAEVPMFMSRAIIKTTFTEVADSANPLQGKFVFKIDDVKLGRLGGVLDLANTFASQSLQDLEKTLQNSFETSGLHIQVDMKNRTLTYTKANLLNDAKAMMGNQALVGDLLSVFFEKNLTTLQSNAGSSMSFQTNLVPLHTNANYVVEDDSLALDLDSYAKNLKTLLDKKAIAKDYQYLGEVQQYLIRGYDGVSETIRSHIQGIDYSSIGISDFTSYKGADLESQKVDIETQMRVRALTNLPKFATDHLIGHITEEEINSMLHASSLIGTSVILAKELPRGKVWANYEDTHTVVYITFNDITAQLVNDHVYLSLAASLNGYDVRFVIPTKINASEELLSQYKIGLTVENIFAGEYEAPASLKASLQEYIAKAFASGDTISYSNDSFIIDFSNSIDSVVRTAVNIVGTPNASIIGSSLSDESARIELGITPRI